MEDLYAEAHRVFVYDPETGILSFKVNRGCHKAGTRVGYFNPNRKNSYRMTTLSGRLTSVHRIVWLMMTGAYPVNHIDHVNMLTDDNRWVNLREANNSQNRRNQVVRADSGTGVKGVGLDKRTGRYNAHIGIDNRRHHIGSFATIEDARSARNAKAEEIHGEFWRAS